MLTRPETSSERAGSCTTKVGTPTVGTPRVEPLERRVLMCGEHPLYSDLEPFTFATQLLAESGGATSTRRTPPTLTLINADTDTEVGALARRATLDLGQLGGLPTVRFDTARPKVSSVRFKLRGPSPLVTIDNSGPYTIAGESGANYQAWNPQPGNHRLVVTAHGKPDAKGRVLQRKVFRFTVTGEPTTTPPPTPPPPTPPPPTPPPPTPPPPAPGLGSWTSGPRVPVSMGEVASGILGDHLYLVGDGSRATVRYDFASQTWSTSAAAQRPHLGHHHAAEVLNGKLYVIGGLYQQGAPTTSAGKLQIYDPATNRWTLGADLPWAGGSINTAVINGQIYAAGGVVNSDASNPAGTGGTTQAARYDPATNTWSALPNMPRGVNHAASATDGSRLFVFGGREGRNELGNGIATVQVYDPAANRWTSSDAAGSNLRPLPIARGGVGKAVFHAGGFYVFGGETLSGPGATAAGVYNRVDIYDPTTNTWRQGADIPVAVHGMFPVLHGTQILIATGGVQAAASRSTLFQIYNPG